MRVGDNIFVYGTLKLGHGANSYLQNRAEYIRDDRVSGKLFDLGAFPGFKVVGQSEVPGEPVPFFSEGPTVHGELFRITDEKLPKMLDSYEGYPQLYGRRRVLTETGETTWVYEYNGNYDELEARLVSSGKWD